MSEEKALALRLADVLEACAREKGLFGATAGAAELRRLHVENERLHQINQSHEMKLSVRGYEIQIADLKALNQELLEALKRADQFITNGIEFGYIRMPDADTPDTAHRTPALVRAAIAKAEGV